MNASDRALVLHAFERRIEDGQLHICGPFLEALKEIASGGRLASFAEACALYLQLSPVSRRYIAGQVPAILANFYFKDLADFDYDRFVRWQIANADWPDSLRQSFLSAAALENAVMRVRFAAENHS